MAEDFRLLALCAILEHFAPSMLTALHAQAPSSIHALLTSDAVIRDQQRSNRFRLAEPLRMDVLSQLRAQQPLLEVELRTQAFSFYIDQLGKDAADSDRPRIEAAMMEQLDKLIPHLLNSLEWASTRAHIAAARRAGLQQSRHQDQLALYDGNLAVRTQDHERGEAILSSLLAKAELPSDLRLNALTALAQLYRNLTHYDLALATYEQLTAAAHDSGAPVFHGLSLINMASVYNELEEYERAFALAQQSLAIFRAENERTREAYALYIAGLNAMYLGRWPIANEYFDAAITSFESLSMSGGLSILYWSRGFLNHLLGDETQSEVAYRMALQLADDPDHGEAALVMETWLQLGLLYQTQERFALAAEAYARALEAAERLRYEHRIALIHYRQARVARSQGKHQDADKFLTQALAVINRLATSTKTEGIKISLLGTIQQVYEAAVHVRLEQNAPADAYHLVERARARAFLDLLASKSPELFDSVDQPVVSVRDVQAALPTGTLVLEYYTTGVLPRGEHMLNMIPKGNQRLREALTEPPTTLLFAITRESLEVHRLALDPNSLRPQPYDPGPGRRLLGGRLPAHLYDRLVAPVQHLVDAATQLIIVPHGPLHYVPFGALRSAENRYLLHRGGPALAFAPSATVLLRNCLARPAGRGDGLLALGYNDEGDDALLYAETEARAVAELLNGQAWTGPEPKRDRLFEHGRHARLLHVAGHAVFDVRDPLASYLRLGRDDVLNAREIIARLELDADVVTLSACTSGLSHVVAGDELLGLQRALLYAGAPTVVCSLWETADLVSRLVMERFYRNLRGGRPVAASLCDAQLAVRELSGADVAATLERWREIYPEHATVLTEAVPEFAARSDEHPFADPFYWAPFMAIGRP